MLAPDGAEVTAAPVYPACRQRHGQGDRPGVPLARNAGERRVREQSAEIAAAEKINESYVGRVLRLTLLAPDIVEAILGGRQPAQCDVGGADAAVCGGVD